jgi:plastocyanin
VKALVAVAAALALGSCGSDNNKSADASVVHDGKAIDAKAIDAHIVDTAPPTPDALTDVETVTCPANPDAIVASTNGNDSSYSVTNTTITVGQIVQFQMASTHNVFPNTGQDPGLHVGFGATLCKKFTVAGTYTFKCTAHLFMGTVTVN